MAKAPEHSLSERFRASPSFSLAFTMDGRPFVAKETEPYIQFWLSERYRILLSMFSGRRGAAIGEAIDGYLRLTGEEDTGALRGRLHRAAIDMVSGGVLIGAREDVSRYSARIVDAYLAHRPFPPEVTAHVVREASIGQGTRVLDLAGGPGDFAVQLAATSQDVSMMELSGGFVKAAARRAAALGRPLQTIHDSCNRLVYLDDEYDVVTVAQALHWLDDVLVCRGLCRVLRPDGSFFVIHGAIELDDAHPLAYVLGHDSVLGRKERQPFLSEVWPIARRLSLLFEALDAPDVQRIDLAQQWGAPGSVAPSRIVPAGVTVFRQRRPYGIGYARGFLTPRHIEGTGLAPDDFWKDLEARCRRAAPEQMIGTHHWAVLHFRRGGAPVRWENAASEAPTDIGYAGPPEQ